jgi:coxsackievirus/adenovirus receptor
LSLELNSISLLPPERIVSVNQTLTLLEQEAAVNQEEVDAIADQVRQLEESANQLRERYVQLQQHRDLLKRILRNIEGLDCRKQFASP